jgi:predicted alpha/beta-hydrolase family hydrolase
MTVAVLAPGYGGTAEQPLLRRLAGRLEEVGIASARVTFSTGGRRPSRGYEVELADLRAARERLLAEHGGGSVVLVGRSFGGRMCAFLAEREPPAGLVVLGHPIAPPGRPRPRDEAALLALRCPTLVVQGERDELGPLPVLERLAAANPRVELSVLPGAGHGLGSLEAEAVERAVAWIVQRVHSAP